MVKTGLLAFAVLSTALMATAQQSVWGQCGGIGWTGPTTCVAGSTCVRQNDYYYQCLPGAATTTSTTTSNPTTTTTRTTTNPGTTTTTSSGSGASCPALRRAKH